MNETVRYNRESYKYQEESHLKVICNVGVLKWFFNLEKKYIIVYYISPTYESLGVKKCFDFTQSKHFALKAILVDISISREGTNKSGYMFFLLKAQRL